MINSRNIIKKVFGLIFWLTTFKRKKSTKLKNSRILIISCIGIGNSILSIPLIKRIKELNPSGQIDILTTGGFNKTIFQNLDFVDHVFSYENKATKTFRLSRFLRKIEYDLCFLTFPTLSMPLLVLPFLIKSKMNIVHDYHSLNPYFKYFSNLFPKPVSINNNLHDIEQNLNLLSSFSFEIAKFNPYPPFNLKDEWKELAQIFLRSLVPNRNSLLFCIHPGSKSGTDYKRWPLKNYISLAKKLKTLKNVNILFLVGPDESEMADHIHIKGFPVLQSKNIGMVIGVINNCNYFISNDSGMMHVSALLGRKIITIWGGTDEKRNGARSTSVFNIINPDVLCRPCVKFIPKNKTFSCQFECIRQTKAIDVFNLISADIKKGKESHES